MEKNQYTRLQLRPHRAERIKLVTEFLHPSYKLEHLASADAGKTGLLRLFSLVSQDSEFPSFEGRWDAKQNAVDVDLVACDDRSKLFKSGKNGYRGHHSVHVEDQRYAIIIAIPQGEVFRGVLELDANAIVYLEEEIKFDIEDELSIFELDPGEEITLGG